MTAVGARRALVWFRRDLRLEDNPAWAAATASADEVAALFVGDPILLRRAPRRCAVLAAALRALDAELRRVGGALLVEHGDPRTRVPAVANRLGAALVVANADVTPYAGRRDRAVEAALAATGASIEWHWGTLVHEPGRILTRAGAVSRVFTPFWRAWNRTERVPWLDPGVAVVLAPEGDARLPDDDGGWEAVLPDGVGTDAAHRRLTAFLERVDAYEEERDRPDLDRTSRLSVDLHLGTISPRLVADAVGGSTAGRAAFVRQLAWRDWWAHLLHARPALVATAMRPELDHIAWRRDPEALAAWRAGRTGYPIVDAAMRELAATGWLHNRLRMVAGSFLVKDLLVDWRLGEAHFRDLLLDGDVAQNVGNWQWVAGTGPDAAPWFRVLHPVVQGRRHDPDGIYVARWVPELAGLPPRWRHAPWEAPPMELASAGVTLGRDYPLPIVDHAEARARAIAAHRAATATRRLEPDPSGP